MFNQRAAYNKDARRLFSGKDALILSESGEILSTVESFQAQVAFSTVNYQPLGSAIQQGFLTGYQVTLTITECIIEDHQFIRDVFEFMSDGRHSPHWTFSSNIYGYNGSIGRYTFRDCIPNSNLDLANITVGDIWKRTWSMICQQPPELSRLLTYA